MVKYYATDRQIFLTILGAIATHPLIVNPPIQYPVNLPGSTNDQVKITKFRAYGGRELSTSGLTLSVYPTKRGKYGTQSTYHFQPYYIGDSGPFETTDKGKLRVTLQLSIQNPDFDTPYSLTYKKAPGDSNTFYGYSFEHIESETQIAGSSILQEVPTSILDISVLPAEMLLQDYLTLLRAVVRDIKILQPYTLRNPQIVYADYETPDVFGESAENLVFHSALLIVEWDTYETNQAREYNQLVEDIGLESSIEQADGSEIPQSSTVFEYPT